MFSLELFHVQTFKEETRPPTCPQLPSLLKIKGSITSHSNIQILAPRDSPQWPGRAAPHNRSGAPYRSAGNRSVAARRWQPVDCIRHRVTYLLHRKKINTNFQWKPLKLKSLKYFTGLNQRNKLNFVKHLQNVSLNLPRQRLSCVSVNNIFQKYKMLKWSVKRCVHRPRGSARDVSGWQTVQRGSRVVTYLGWQPFAQIRMGIWGPIWNEWTIQSLRNAIRTQRRKRKLTVWHSNQFFKKIDTLENTINWIGII